MQKRGWILAALMLTMALAAMDSTIVSTVIPQIVSDLGGFTKFSWVFSIYLLAQTITIPVYGKLADLFGRKKILLFGIVVFLLGSASCATAWNMASLIAFRGIQGLGAGSIMATVNTIAGDIYTVKERAKIQGLLSSIWGMSAILGPALGGALAEYINWRWIFIINIPIGLLSISFLTLHFKENIVPKSSKIDYKGAFSILLSLSLLFIFLMEGGQSWAWLTPQSISLLLAVLALLLLTYFIEKRTPHAIMPLWIWKNKTLAFNNLAIVGMGIVMMGPEAYIPTFAQTTMGLGTIASGFILASLSLGWPLATTYSDRFYMKIGFKNTSLLGGIIVIIACSIFLLIPQPKSPFLLIADMMLMGAGFGLISTSTLVGIQSMVDWEHRGVVTGANMFCRNLGQSLGAAILGAIFNNTFLHHIQYAPADIPSNTKDILGILHSSQISASSKVFLQDVISLSMTHVYWGLILFALLIITFIIFIPYRSIQDKSLIEVQ